MCDVSSVAVCCSESAECFPGVASKFFLKLFFLLIFWWLLVITDISLCFRFYFRCISIHKILYFSFFSCSLCMTLLLVGIATSISMHVFSFVFNYYIWPFCCNISVCLYCLIPQYCNGFLFMYWLGRVCVCVCVCTICLSFHCQGLCILSNANVHKLYCVSLSIHFLLK